MLAFLNKLTPIARGMNIRMIMTFDRISAIQGLLLGVWRGDNITLGPGLRKGFSRGGLRIDLARGPRVRGGGSLRPLQLVASRPAYIPEPAAAVAGSLKRIFITWGTINNVIADNWDDEFDVSGIVTTYFFAKVTFSLSTDDLKVASWEILTDLASDAHETPEWAAGGVRPLYYVISLGAMLVSSVVVETEGEPDETVYTHTLIPAPTSRMLTEHVSNIGGTGTAGEITLTKQISHYSV